MRLSGFLGESWGCKGLKSRHWGPSSCQRWVPRWHRAHIHLFGQTGLPFCCLATLWTAVFCLGQGQGTTALTSKHAACCFQGVGGSTPPQAVSTSRADQENGLNFWSDARLPDVQSSDWPSPASHRKGVRRPSVHRALVATASDAAVMEAKELMWHHIYYKYPQPAPSCSSLFHF